MNELKTIILLGLLTAILVSIVYGIIGDESGLYIGLTIAAVINFSLWYYCDRLALSLYQAQPLNRRQKRTILPMVERLCQRADLPLPQVYIIPMSLPNAFATGRDAEHGVIALTEGIIDLLPSEELEGVIAHELSHIKHHDTLISTIAATLGNAISLLTDFLSSGLFFSSKDNNFFSHILRWITVLLAPITSIIIQLAISRTREYKADEGAAKITNNPRALANALQRLENYCYHFSDDYNMAFSSLFIINPLSGNSLEEIFSTHPPTKKRIKKLLDYEVNRDNFQQQTMNDQEDDISEEQLQEILEEAARLYEKSKNNYSVEEVEKAAQEAGIPSDYFRQALQDIEKKKEEQKRKNKQVKKILKNVLNISLFLCTLLSIWIIFTYNNLTNEVAIVEGKWAQVENQFQRRADLIPTLIKVTETYSNQEKNLIELLITSRRLYLQAITPEEKYQGIKQINEAIAKFQEYVADNSHLQSNQLFVNLQYEIIGTENRIAVERMRYNQSVQKYNQSLHQFPNLIISKPLGFEPKPFYQFDEIRIQSHH